MTHARPILLVFVALMTMVFSVAGAQHVARADEAPVEAGKAEADKAEAGKSESGEEAKGHDDHGKAGGDSHGQAHGAGHHDPYDLAEGNAGPMLTKPDDLKFDLAIYTAVVFFLLLGILGKFAWGPICHALEEREQGIAAKIDEARLNAEKTAENLRLYEEKLTRAAEEARDLIAQARRDGEALREQIVTEAQATAQRERERAIADIATARDVALRDIAQRSVDTAISLASNIVRRELRPQDHQVLVREVLEKLPSRN